MQRKMLNAFLLDHKEDKMLIPLQFNIVLEVLDRVMKQERGVKDA